jgi:hypothetical protein
MTTLNQTGLPDLMFRRYKMSRWAIALIQSFTLILAALAANAQTTPVATGTNASVSAAEVTAFTQSFQKDPAASFKISANPKRVPLLLAAIQREPAGPWVQFLQGFCFGSEHTTAWRLPPAKRSEVYSQAIEYLSTARSTVSKAFAADPQNRRLKDNLDTLDAGLALAYVELGTRSKEVLTTAEALLASNVIGNVGENPRCSVAGHDFPKRPN